MPTNTTKPAPAKFGTPRDRASALASQYHRLGIGAVAAAALAVRKPNTPLTARPPVAAQGQA